MEELKVLELFGGIGAIRKAFERQNIPHKVVDYVEIDEFAVKSYNAVYGTNFEPQDISKWDKDIEVDFIMHGSPCQDFSIAGLQKGGDEGSGTRSSLMYETIRLVKKLNPKYVVWENVKNLISDKHSHNFNKYLKIMESLGFNNYYKVLNAKNYGIPQNRERVFTVSIRKDIDDRTFYFPKEKPLTLRLKDLLEDNVDERYYLSDDKLDSISNWNAYQKPLENVLGQNSISPTLTARGAGEEHAGMITYSDDFENTTNVQKTLNENTDKIMKEDITRTIFVRKYPVDTDKLKELLKVSKLKNNKTIEEIASELELPVTQVEHYFRQDDGFTIPNADIWPKLKEILNIETDEFDKSIMTYEKKNTTFEMNNRAYHPEGITPTLTSAMGTGGDNVPKIIEYKGKEVELPAVCASRGRNLENPTDRTPGQKLEQTIEVNTDGVSNTLTTFQKDNYVLESEPQVLKRERTEFGKSVRKEYESGNTDLTRNDVLQYVPRTDGITNTITTVQKDNYVIENPPTLQYVGSIKDKDIVGDNKNLSRNASIGDRVYDSNGVAATISAQGGGVGSHSGLYTVDEDPDIDNPLKGISGQSWQFEQNVYSENSKCIRTIKAGEGSGNIPKIIENQQKEEMQKIADEINKNAKHQQDLVQTEHDDFARTLVAGTHGNASSYTKTIVSEPYDDTKINVVGNYKPSKHSSGRILNTDGIAPTVMENHGAVTAIVEDNSDKNKKEQLCDYMIDNEMVEPYDVINHGYTEHRFSSINQNKDIVMSKNMAPTITTRPDELGVTVPYNKDEAKIIEHNHNAKHQHELIQDENGISRCVLATSKASTGEHLKTVVREPNHNSYKYNLRIRKLTPKECWRLMGFDDEDFDKAAKVNSNAQLYKQAGNSIVVNVLEALINSMFRPDTSLPKRAFIKKLF